MSIKTVKYYLNSNFYPDGIERAGVLVKIKVNDDYIYFFPVQGKRLNSYVLGDFAGRIETHETVFQTAEREFKEESLNVFSSYYTDEDWLNSRVIIIENTLYVLLNLTLPDINLTRYKEFRIPKVSERPYHAKIVEIKNNFREKRKMLDNSSPDFLKETIEIVDVNLSTLLNRLYPKHDHASNKVRCSNNYPCKETTMIIPFVYKNYRFSGKMWNRLLNICLFL